MLEWQNSGCQSTNNGPGFPCLKNAASKEDTQVTEMIPNCHPSAGSENRRWRCPKRTGDREAGQLPCHPAMSKTFNSFSKGLFIFRSHYLFAIGLGAIFSLRRSTPAFWCSTLKLHDSWRQKGWRLQRVGQTGRSPSLVNRS